MAFDPHKNFAVSTVAVLPSPAASGTSLTVASGEGARFPAAPFNATIGPIAAQPTPANAEIVRVTARTGDVFTVVRAQEGTTARTVQLGDLIAATITAKTLTDIETLPSFDAVYEAGRTTAMGYWIDVSFNAANFFTLEGATSWTVSTTYVNAYTAVGKTVMWNCYTSGTIVGTPTHLYAVLPAGVAAARYYISTCAYTGPLNEQGSTQIASGGLKLDIARTLGAPSFVAGAYFIGWSATFSIS